MCGLSLTITQAHDGEIELAPSPLQGTDAPRLRTANPGFAATETTVVLLALGTGTRSLFATYPHLWTHEVGNVGKFRRSPELPKCGAFREVNGSSSSWREADADTQRVRQVR